MAYGFKSRRKSSARSVNRSTRARSARVKKMGYRKPARRSFVAKRLSRREIKYDDDYFNLNNWESGTQNMSGLASGYVNWVLGGVVTTLKGAGVGINYIGPIVSNQFGLEVETNDRLMMPNCLTNVLNGTTAKTRIGNLISPRYITIKGVLNAARTLEGKDSETTYKTDPLNATPTIVARYMRTSIKMFIIRDKSMNEKGYVTYQDVFEVPDQAASMIGGQANTNPFLWNRKVDVISRYDIIKEYKFELDQDDPQVSFTYTIPLMGKAIRYNGGVSVQADGYETLTAASFKTQGADVWPTLRDGIARRLKIGAEAQSMTNGIYVLAVAHSSVADTMVAANYASPVMVFSSRLTFEDN